MKCFSFINDDNWFGFAKPCLVKERSDFEVKDNDAIEFVMTVMCLSIIQEKKFPDSCRRKVKYGTTNLITSFS